MMSTKRESGLLKPVSSYIRGKGFRQQESEMRFFEYRIDRYGFSTALGLTVAVELKLTKWRRAIEQALIYQLCSDLVYIAVPLKTALRIERSFLMEHGIGLLAVRDSGRCQEVLPAMQSHVIRAHYKQLFIEHLKEGRHG